MSRKILQVGTDILTINDKLVSVKEDYPFWKVNANTSEQYFNALGQDLATPPTVELMMTPFEITSSNTFGTCNGMISASNGSIYTIPSAATTITKITPNPDNVNTPTITNVGTFSSTANKFTSAHEVGSKIYFIPATFESIMILDLSNDSLSFIGSLGATANKFGKSALADNGLIIAPANASTQHLIFNPQTSQITLQTAITAGIIQQARGVAVNAGNGFIYMAANNSGSNYRITKINTDTLVESLVSTSITDDNLITSGFAYNGVIYFYRPTNSAFYIFNTNDNDSRVVFSSGVSASVPYSSYNIGSDGWVYYFHIFTTNAGQVPHFRINPINNTIQISSFLSNNTVRNQCSVMGIDGNIYSVNLANKINVYDFNSNKEIVPNRIYSRYNIR